MRAIASQKMKVKDLIKRLQELNPDMEVGFHNSSDFGDITVDFQVEVSNVTKKILWGRGCLVPVPTCDRCQAIVVIHARSIPEHALTRFDGQAMID